MALRSVLILSAVFLLLLAGVILDRRNRDEQDGFDQRSIISASPSQIDRLAVEQGSERVELRRDAAGWLIERDEILWPANERRVNAALRLISSSSAQRADQPAASDPLGDGLRWKITANGAETNVELADGVLSGRRVASIEGESVLLDGELADMLTPDGVFAWLDPTALPGFGPDVFKLALDRGGDSIALSRVGTRWGVTSPIASPAEPQRIATIIGQLSSITGTHRTSEIVAGEPVITLTARAPGRRWTLQVDDDGIAGIVATSGEVSLSTTITLSDESRSVLDFDVASLLSRTALDLPGSDIVALELQDARRNVDATLERISRTWSSNANVASALLEVLTSLEAESVRIEPPPPESGVLLVRRFGDLPVASLHVWPTEGALTINDGSVSREFSSESEPVSAVLDWLSRPSD
ncbi:MAG: hypothetical protein AAFO89_00920 [Planctomycetota bacterium]